MQRWAWIEYFLPIEMALKSDISAPVQLSQTTQSDQWNGGEVAMSWTIRKTHLISFFLHLKNIPI